MPHADLIIRPLRAAFAWLGLHELPALLAVAVLSGGVWVFLEVADEVVERESAGVDESLLLALRTASDPDDPLGPAWVEEMARDFTALGGTGVLTLITGAALGYLLLAGRRRTALLTLAAVAGGLLISTLLKAGFDRPRPDLVPHESVVYTASFPSGHSMMAAVTYLTLAAILTRVLATPLLKAWALLVAGFLTLLVGVSRVYLGVHWPTDVPGGWAAGAAWAALCWLGARQLQRRRLVESGQDRERPVQD
ncbi:MAG TPA: phosphatase PAP2 family protein [Woeseiaceae bacterium]|nr:phosphatase PAP2 family protein [Woeseiaceae bacterium]